MKNEMRIAIVVIWLSLVAVMGFLDRTTDAINRSTKIEARSEYERVLLGCHSAGAISSEDKFLRELCDDELPEIRARLEE